MNTKLRRQAKNYFEKNFLKLMNNAGFEKRVENVRMHRDIKLVTTDKRRNTNYEVNRPLPTGKDKKEIGLMKVELRGKTMTEFVALKPKTYSYLMDDGWNDEKAKGTKKCVIKRRLEFNDYKDCLLNNKIVLKSQQRFKTERHDVYTDETTKIALSSNDDKRLQTFDRITSYLY